MSFYEQSEPEFRIRQKGEPVGENPEFPAPRFYQIDSPIILLTESIHTGEACASDRSRTRAFQRFRGGKQGRPRGQHVVDKDHPLPLAGIQGPEAPPCVFQPARMAQPALIPCTAGLEQALEGQAQKTRALPCEKLAVVETAPTTGGIGSRHAGERICRMQPARRDGASHHERDMRSQPLLPRILETAHDPGSGIVEHHCGNAGFVRKLAKAHALEGEPVAFGALPPTEGSTAAGTCLP